MAFCLAESGWDLCAEPALRFATAFRLGRGAGSHPDRRKLENCRQAEARHFGEFGRYVLRWQAKAAHWRANTVNVRLQRPGRRTR
jgi:hypothetical protein